MRLRATRVEIDLSAVRHNLTCLRRWAGPTFFCPMVKADAYGHGALIIARVAEELKADAVGVSLIEEGIELRQAGIQIPILVFAPFDEDGARLMQRHRLTPVVSRSSELEVSVGFVDGVHLKFNTGMQRLGFDEDSLPHLRSRLKELGVQVSGLCTHFTHGEDILQMDGPTQRQIEKFLAMTQGFPGVRHCHKSATLAQLRDSSAYKELGARPGIAVYGLPYEGRETGPGLRPVLSWHTQLVHWHRVAAGQGVGYGARHRTTRVATIGVLPVGYGDGYMRTLGEKADVLWRGKRVPIVGSVCMDYILVDLTDGLAERLPQQGEPVILIGRQGTEEISAGELAEQAGTIAYETVTAISPRVPREVK